jgi:hypothetical protein
VLVFIKNLMFFFFFGNVQHPKLVSKKKAQSLKRLSF